MAAKSATSWRGGDLPPNVFRITVLDYDSGEVRRYDVDLAAVAATLGVSVGSDALLSGIAPSKGVLISMDNGSAWVKPSRVGSPLVTLPTEPVVSDQYPRVMAAFSDGLTVRGTSVDSPARMVKDGAFLPGAFTPYYYTPAGGSFGTEYVYNDFFLLGGALVGYGTRAAFPSPTTRSASNPVNLGGASGMTPDLFREASNTIGTVGHAWLAGLAMMVGAQPPQFTNEMYGQPVTSVTGSESSATITLHGKLWGGGVGVAKQQATASYSGGIISLVSQPTVVGPIHQVVSEGGGVLSQYELTYVGDWPAESGGAPTSSFWTDLVYASVIP